MASELPPNTQIAGGLYQAVPTVLSDQDLTQLRLDQQGRLRVVAEGSPSASPTMVTGSLGDGSVGDPSPVIIGGRTVSGNIRTVQVDSDGKIAIRALLSGDIQLTVADAITVFSNTLPDGSGTPLVPIVDGGGYQLMRVVSEQAAIANGSAGLPSQIKVVGGYDGADSRALLINATGALRIDPVGTTTQPVSLQLPGSSVNAYGSANLVAANLETTVSSYIVPPGSTLHIAGATASGDVGSCRYAFYINGIISLARRSSIAQPTVDLDFRQTTPVALGGQIVKVTVIHYLGGIQGNFESTIMGYLTTP